MRSPLPPDGLRRHFKGGGGGSQNYANLDALYKEQTDSARLLREQAEANLRDLEFKVTSAMGIHGARYIHIHVPCPLGWGSASHDTIKLARLARETGIFPVFEARHGEVTSVTKIRHRVPVDEYLKPQKRFAHLFGKDPDTVTIARLQAIADRNIRRYALLDEEN